MIYNYKQDNFTDIILDSIADGVFTIDSEWKITSFNRAAEKITSIPREEALGQRCSDIFRASICENNCALKQTLKAGRPIVNKAVYIIDSSGKKIPISVATAVLRDADGRVIGGVETFRDLSEIMELRRQLHQKYSYQDIISKNSQMLKIFDILPTIAESDSTVLVEGESGTGKELVARAVHNLSPRKSEPIVVINCGAMPDTLLESELFGYVAGAFTDARKDKPGRFAMAEGGTVLLDEIADVSPAMQVRLLRVIQEHTYQPLGSTQPVKADVRIIAASNQNLKKLVTEGKFREDLYYRINVIRIELPPLRERKEDIPLLMEHFIERFNRLKPKQIDSIAPEVLAVLMNYDFPGNVRELENIAEHAFVLCRNSIISMNDLPENFKPQYEESIPAVNSFEDLEARFLVEALKRNNWSRINTARELGIHKTTLWRKMKKYGIDMASR
ncbi:MAG: PAS domain-containing protein [candidate division Zixibacteria bacterium]|nr:PAS domain-containing protein [candidate division Zixibacteria bacterium]